MRLRQFMQVEPKNKEELITLLRATQNRALINAETLSMIEGVIQFANMQVRDIMLPKKQMVSIPMHAELNEIIATVTSCGHSRFPVFQEHSEEIIGILHAKDLLRFNLPQHDEFNLHDLIRLATFVPESKRLDLLLTEFRSNRNHMAIVVDEYGAVSGFVTIEDIIEQIIGDIEDEFDIDKEAYIKAHNDSHFVVKAHTPIKEFNEQLHADFSDEDYDTVGGIVMANFGYLPKRGEIIAINNFEFKIINADARGIKLLACYDKRPEKLPKTQIS